MKLSAAAVVLLLQAVLMPMCAGQGSGSMGQGSNIPYLVGISPIITYVREDSESNHELVDLHAYDPDGMVVSYSLDVNTPFDIDPNLGRIFVTGLLDRETTDAYILVATVTDAEGLSGNITIDVAILDVNDNAPMVANSRNITIRELTEVGTRIHTIITTDPDIGNAGSVEFSVISNGDSVTDRSFSIGQFSGDITLVQSLDHEAVGLHVLTVRIADLGTPVQSTLVNISVNVLDESDAAPIFTRSLYTGRVPEGDTQGVPVVRVIAVDADNLGAQINYSIVFGNENNAFRIGNDGLIVTENRIDRETRSRYILTVEATEASSTSDASASTTTVTVEVGDVNDNSPQFYASLYTGFAREDAVVGTNVITSIAAFDNDLGDNAEFRFRLSPQNAIPVPFAIDPNRGVISVNAPLDFETNRSHQFEIEVYEIRSAEMLSGNATVHIFIINANDNPPIFEFDTYNESVLEEQLPGQLVGRIQATDGDAGSAGILTYRLSGGGSERFAVNDDGDITTTEVLDREETAQYHLTLIAMDISNNPLIVTTTVIISVNDLNDNCPEFDPSINYNFILLEGMMHNNFFTPIVVDRDIGLNAQYTFSISDNTNFNVSSTTGTLSLIVALDHEVITNRYLPVVMTACDMGTNPRMMCCNQTINVTLRDVNDNMPEFIMDPFVEIVYENFTEGDVVVTASAIDMDHGTNAELRYTFVNNDDAGPFLINYTTGDIYTVNTLDWESQPYYSFQVRAEDRGDPPLQDITTVNITVVDVNEFTPLFDNPIINVVVLENVPPGYVLTTISTSDPDGPSDGEVTYVIEGNSTSVFFMLQSNGLLTTTIEPDRETSSNVIFDVRASDQGNPMLYSTATVNITILDENDNCPEFDVVSYTLAISESTPTGGSVIQVNATDADSGLNGEIVYAMGPNSPAQFAISRETGLITVDPNNPLDYETNATYSFTVEATDMGNISCTTRSQAFIITVIDANDNVCAFSPTPIYNETFSETGVVSDDTVLITFTTTDADQLGTDNSRIFYYIDQRDDNQLLVLNSTTGELYVPAGESLDRDRLDINQAPNCRGIYRYRIEGRDQGNPPLSCYADVFLYISDINDNAPVFEILVDPVRVSESAIIGSLVHVASAIDSDCGSNAEVVYSIIDGNNMSSFRIDDRSGAIVVNGILDKETTEEYNLTIFAMNVGSSSYNATTNIYIVVVDHNDNNPACSPQLIQLCINESDTVGTEITTVNCTDPDSTIVGNGTDVVYGFGGGNINGSFAIDSATGIISLARAVDRETVDFYHLTVYAEDTGTPPRRGFTQVTICLLDVDDNCPVFSQMVYSGSVSEDAVPGTPVTVRPSLSVTDADVGVNAEIVYSFGMGSSDQFSIANDTGFITVIGSDLDRENMSRINISLAATDNPACDMAILEIELVDINDNRPMFINFPNTAEICEDVSIGTRLVNITASDRDSGSNSVVTFHLINSDEDFAIDRSSGWITINRPLDRERKEEYNITVVATDNGLPPLSSSAALLVTILDVNDNIPRFEPSNIDTCIPEHSNSSVIVLQLSDYVIDGDMGLNGQITYSIIGAGSVPFTVGFEDGVVNPKSPADMLDREIMDTWVVNFQVIDQGGNNSGVVDTSPSSKCTSMTTPPVDISVRICLEDINDNCPTFSQDTYIIDVLEGTAANTIVFHLVATDIDIGSNAEILYTFSSSVPESGLTLFSINSITGIITTTAQVEALVGESVNAEELESSYQILVLAEDQGKPPCATPINVTIRIRDANDNSPMCNQTFYEFNITENVTAPTLVGEVSAYDLDVTTGHMHMFNFSIVEHPSQPSMFDVDSTTGEITTNQILDREQFSTHIITVVVTDTHNASRAGYCTVFVTVDDQNDECPMFLNGSGVQLFVMENAAFETYVGQVAATDADIGTNAMISYIIRAGDLGGHFEIGLNTGVLETTVNTIDREMVSNFSLMICAIDAGPMLDCGNSCINITVLVQDACDHNPVFDNLPREVNISELLVVGDPVTTVIATDMDLGLNAVIRYSITSGNTNDTFIIGEFSGALTLANDLDYETTTIYILRITATDFCNNGGRNQTETLTIRVVNENDQPPECPIIDPFPNTTEGLNITNFYSYPASTTDAPPYNVLTYAILPVPTGNVFSIHQLSGNISIVHGDLLDRETRSIYCETVMVNSSSLSCSAQFCVNIIDANDNCPMFPAPVIYTSAPEAVHIGVTVDTITAVDIDIGTNAIFEYRIANGTDQGLFNISNEGRIITAAVLDRENTSSYNSLTLVVEAVDKGTPAQTCSATINITILDANDNSPSFVECTSPHFVVENAPFGLNFLNLTAVDKDIGENARVSYHFGADANEFGPFQINRGTGQLVTVGQVDRETLSSYTVTIYATDHGAPTTRESTCTININITDQNDNIPSFVMNPLFTLCEDASVGVPLVQLSTVSFDLDIAPNDVIYYYNPLNLSSNCIGSFCFDSSTGSVSLAEELDFETAETHSLRVAVSNDNLTTFSLSNIERYRVANITVEVCDVNDVTPQFTTSVFIIGMDVTTDVGDVVYQVAATDPENGDFGVVWYRTVSSDNRFLVAQETGNVISNMVAQGNAGEQYTVEIEAYDNKGRSPSLATRRALTVWVLHNSQRVIITMDITLDLVLAKRQNISNILNSVTGYTIIIEKIRIAENDDQTNIFTSKTDVIVYGVDSETNTIVNQDIIIAIIDNNFLRISNLLAECKVETVRPFPTTRDVTESTFEDRTWLIIVGALVILIFLLCCCLFLCCIICRRQRKVVKHNETVDSYESTMRQFTVDQTKNTNPLWLAPYRQWEQGSETKEVEFSDTQSREEGNALYESKEILLEMLPPPDSVNPSTHSLAMLEPPAGATAKHASRQGQAVVMTKTYSQSYEQETQFISTTENVTYDRESVDSDMVEALLDDTLNQPGNRESNTMELLAAVASDEDFSDDKDDTALL